MQVKKQQLEQDVEQQTGSKLRKEYTRLNIVHPIYEEYIMQNTGLVETRAGIKILGGISITSDMQMTPLLVPLCFLP